jgi:hypothetical protein
MPVPQRKPKETASRITSCFLAFSDGHKKLSDRRRFRHRQDFGLQRIAAARLHATNGDNELACQGDPETGKPLNDFAHEHHIWRVDQVEALVADQDEAVNSSAVVPGTSRNSYICLSAFSSLKSTVRH